MRDWPSVVGQGIVDNDLAIPAADAALEGNARWAETTAPATPAGITGAAAAVEPPAAATPAEAAATSSVAAHTAQPKLSGGARS